MPDANVTFYRPAGDDGPNQGVSGILTDHPEARAALEREAIPGCWLWRKANPEPLTHPGDLAAAAIDGRPATMPAPYCCSAYCLRCAGLRALDGVEPLTPNQWMET